MNITTLIAFTLYIGVVVSIALVAYLVTRNISDFVLGGRSLGGAVAALSAGASDMSAWLLLGLPGAVYEFGLNQIWLPIGLVIGAYVNWLYVAKPLRVYTEIANDSLTIPSYLDNRFRDDSRIIRLISALAILFFFAFYTASGLVAGALLMGTTFDLDYHTALFVGTGIIVAYTFIGGFLAVSWTDFFQGTLMFVCLLLIPFLAVDHLGGWNETTTAIKKLEPHATQIMHGLSAIGIINLFAWGLGYFGQPHILVRFMAVKSTKEIPLARRICMGWMSLSMLGAVLCGFVGIAYFHHTLGNPETVFINFSKVIFTPWAAGLVMAAILSSTMCAIDSQMLASSSALTEDIYHLFRKDTSPGELMWIGRIAVIIIAILAVSLALSPSSKVLTLVGFAWAGLGSTFGPSVVFSLFWKNMTRSGAIWGMSLGAITVILWKFLLNPYLVSHEIIEPIYEMIPGISMSLLGVIAGSLLGTKSNAEIYQEFSLVKESL